MKSIFINGRYYIHPVYGALRVIEKNYGYIVLNGDKGIRFCKNIHYFNDGSLSYEYVHLDSEHYKLSALQPFVKARLTAEVDEYNRPVAIDVFDPEEVYVNTELVYHKPAWFDTTYVGEPNCPINMILVGVTPEVGCEYMYLPLHKTYTVLEIKDKFVSTKSKVEEGVTETRINVFKNEFALIIPFD